MEDAPRKCGCSEENDMHIFTPMEHGKRLKLHGRNICTKNHLGSMDANALKKLYVHLASMAPRLKFHLYIRMMVDAGGT